MASNAAVRRSARSRAGALIGGFARSRELTLVAVLLVLAALVAIEAPNFLSSNNVISVTSLAAIIAIAAVGEALIILTKNIDLSVESTMGLVAFVVAVLLKQQNIPMPVAWALGIGLGLALGMVNGIIITVFRVPSIVATLGTLSIFRGLTYLVANGHEINANDLPAGYTNAASQTFFDIPLFVILAVAVVAVAGLALRYTVFGRQLYAVGSNAEAAATVAVALPAVAMPLMIGSPGRPACSQASRAFCGGSNSGSSTHPLRAVSRSRSSPQSLSAESRSQVGRGRSWVRQSEPSFSA